MSQIENCLHCKRDTTMLEGDTKVSSGTIIAETCCLSCAIVFRDIVRHNTTTNKTIGERVRATFTNHGRLSKYKLAELKCQDQTLYTQWVAMLEHLEGTLTAQIGNNYSEHATHFLYTTRIMVRYLKTALKRRIEVINLFLKGLNDSE